MYLDFLNDSKSLHVGIDLSKKLIAKLSVSSVSADYKSGKYLLVILKNAKDNFIQVQ